MRAGFFTLLAVALAACSQLPVQQRVVGGDIIKSAANDYAVFAENGAAVAIKMGTESITDDMAPAVNAIKRATNEWVSISSLGFKNFSNRLRLGIDLASAPRITLGEISFLRNLRGSHTLLRPIKI